MDAVVRPLLIGMNNPQGSHPLWPDPPGCTGHRIWEMIHEITGCEKRQYLRVFERDNLVDERAWCAVAGRARREAFLTRMQGRTTVLLGVAVPSCLGLYRPPWGSWAATPRRDLFADSDFLEKSRYCIIPHPSGLNRFYNDPNDRTQIATLLASLYVEGRHALGLPYPHRRPQCLSSELATKSYTASASVESIESSTRTESEGTSFSSEQTVLSRSEREVSSERRPRRKRERQV